VTGVPKSSYLYFQTFSLAESKNCYVVVVFVVVGGGGVLSLFEGALTNGILLLYATLIGIFASLCGAQSGMPLFRVNTLP